MDTKLSSDNGVRIINTASRFAEIDSVIVFPHDRGSLAGKLPVGVSCFFNSRGSPRQLAKSVKARKASRSQNSLLLVNIAKRVTQCESQVPFGACCSTPGLL